MVLLLYQVAARRWLTPYRADALTLTTSVLSSQFPVLSKSKSEKRTDNSELNVYLKSRLAF